MSIFKFHSAKMGRFGVPFGELEKMRDHMESVYNSLAGSVSQIHKKFTAYPLVNLAEDGENLYLTAELPGVDASQLDISVKGDSLSLSGNLGEVSEADTGEVSYHRRERERGTFFRSVNLPVKVEPEATCAEFKNGILTLTMPKAAEAKAHRIVIKTEEGTSNV